MKNVIVILTCFILATKMLGGNGGVINSPMISYELFQSEILEVTLEKITLTSDAANEVRDIVSNEQESIINVYSAPINLIDIRIDFETGNMTAITDDGGVVSIESYKE